MNPSTRNAHIAAGGAVALFAAAIGIGVASAPKDLPLSTPDPAPVVAAASTPQQVVDQHEIKMRWACEDAIKAQLNDPRSYEAERVRFAPQTMDEHPDQVVDAHIAFRARNGFGGMVGGFARCGFNNQGEIVRQPNVVSN